jgi:serine/threonine protein phosphatase PrpC
MARPILEIGFATDVGRQRQRNEDSYGVFVPTDGETNPSQLAALLLVADGMGGERAGDRASRMAVEQLRQWFSSGAYRSWPECTGERPLEAVLVRAVRDVSNAIYKVGDADPTIRGLGSTVVIGALAGHAMTLAHVGDSRCYHVRGNEIRLLTSDHSWVQRQVDAGLLTAEDARRHPQRNILIRSLGDALPPDVDTVSVEVDDGDLFVLCTDGLTGGVSDEEILQFTTYFRNPQQLADALVRLANDKDGSDNITVVVGRCRLDGAGHRYFDNQATQRIELHDGDTRVNMQIPVPLPESAVRGHREVVEPPPLPPEGGGAGWRKVSVAALLAFGLGLIAGYWQEGQRARSSEVTAVRQEPSRLAAALD